MAHAEPHPLAGQAIVLPVDGVMSVFEIEGWVGHASQRSAGEGDYVLGRVDGLSKSVPDEKLRRWI